MRRCIACVAVGILAAGTTLIAPAVQDPDALPAIRVGHVGHDHQLALYVAALESASRGEAWGVYLHELKPREVYELVEKDRPIARLHLVKTGGGSAMPAAMSRGELDIGLGGTIAVAKFIDAGQAFKIVCPLQTDGDQFVMRKGSAITNWPSFVAAAKANGKPLRIGYKEPMAVAKMVFERALTEEGIAYGRQAGPGVGVVLLNFGSEKSPLPLLESNAIDGFVMNQPGPAIAVSKQLAQVVAELRDLPPTGKWVNHPCCCVAATERAIAAYRAPLKALLKLLILSTRLIGENQPLAIDCAVRWTKSPPAVEARSVPSVTYITEPTAAWLSGMRTWFEMVKPLEFFKGKYANMSPDEFVRDVCDLGLCRDAALELAAAGSLENK